MFNTSQQAKSLQGIKMNVYVINKLETVDNIIGMVKINWR